MPSRDENQGNRPRRVVEGSGEPKEQRTAPTPQTGDDVWDTINDMKAGSSGGSGEFNKMNTSFFLRDGEEAEIVFIDENPIVFFGHNIKCATDAGKVFYRTEQCQKSEQDSCIYCDSSTGNSAIGKPNRVIAFRILDGRGKWDSNKGALDGNPAPKIFLAPVAFAKQVKTLKDEAGGTISDKVIKITKNGSYIPQFKMNKLATGGFDYDYVDESVFDDMKLPEVLDVYAPLSDDDALDFLDKFSAKGGGQKPAQQNSGGFGSAQGQRPARQVGGLGRGSR